MPLSFMLTMVDEHWELQAAALLQAVWWDFRFADGLVSYISENCGAVCVAKFDDVGSINR